MSAFIDTRRETLFIKEDKLLTKEGKLYWHKKRNFIDTKRETLLTQSGKLYWHKNRKGLSQHFCDTWRVIFLLFLLASAARCVSFPVFTSGLCCLPFEALVGYCGECVNSSQSNTHTHRWSNETQISLLTHLDRSYNTHLNAPLSLHRSPL